MLIACRLHPRTQAPVTFARISVNHINNIMCQSSENYLICNPQLLIAMEEEMFLDDLEEAETLEERENTGVITTEPEPF